VLVKNYTENEESTFVSTIPTFVKQAEERIHRAVLSPELRNSVTGTMSQGNRFLTTPTDFLSVSSIAVIDQAPNAGDYEFLLHKDVNFVREAYPANTTQAKPVYYSVFDDSSFILGPTPDKGYTVQISYYYKPASIVTLGSNETTWLGKNGSSALLYGTLLEAYTFMKGEADLINLYGQRYEEAVGQLMILGEGRNRRDSYRNGEPLVRVT
jgi:hypothetical protein